MFSKCKNINECKQLLCELQQQARATGQPIKEIVIAYKKALAEFAAGKAEKFDSGKEYAGNTGKSVAAIDAGQADKVTEILSIKSITVEACGCWLWIAAPKDKDINGKLKAAGCRWSKNKSRWYYKPAGSVCFSRGNRSMEYIRGKYGSQLLKEEKEEKSA